MVYPGKFDVMVQQIFTEQQIILTYWEHWSKHMLAAGKQSQISLENCVNDFVTVNFMYSSYKDGTPVIKPAKPEGTVVTYDVQDKGFDADTSQWVSRGRTFTEEQSAVNFCTALESALKSGNATGKEYRVVKIVNGCSVV